MFRLNKCRQENKKAQVSLEIAMSLVCVFILLLGVLKVFVWVNNSLVMRHEDYESTRVKAGRVESSHLITNAPRRIKRGGPSGTREEWIVVSTEPFVVMSNPYVGVDESKYPRLDISGSASP